MKQFYAEAIGTFSMVFCGCGAMTINDITNGLVTPVGIAITWGLIVMAMIFAFGDISGAHFNPAVTVAFAAAKLFPKQEVPKYIAAQAIGAFFAIFILWILFPEGTTYGSSIPMEGFASFKVFIIEFLLTFFLMLVILNVSTGSKEIGTMAALAVGGVILLAALFAGPITKASMNPIRSVAPAVFSGHLELLWVYLTAPFLGALTAVKACGLVKGNSCCN